MRQVGVAFLAGMALMVAACSPEVEAEANETDEASAEVAPLEAATLKEEAPGLLARATVKEDAARATVLALVPSGRITGAEIEEEDGLLIYSFAVTVQGVTGIEEVNVDALTGKVVSQEHEDAAEEAREADEEDEADEPGEASGEHEGAHVPLQLQR
jgi:uncharacterized membrane protein YkoI